jgi:hypothetical protein
MDEPELYVTVDQASAAWPPFGKLPQQEQADLIADASEAVRNYVRRPLLERTYVETYDGTGLGRIRLRKLPVTAIGGVVVNGEALDNATGDGWSFDRETGELRRGDGRDDVRFAPWFPKGRGNIEVTYSAGYQQVPGPVKRATILTMRWLREAVLISLFAQSESIGNYSYTRGVGTQFLAVAGLPAFAASLLEPYVIDDIH